MFHFPFGQLFTYIGAMTETEWANSWRDSVAAALRMALAESGISRLSLARDSGISDSTLGRYFKGTRDLPVDVLFQITPFMDTTPDQVVAMARAVFEKRSGMSWDEHVLAAKRGHIDPDEPEAK